MQLIVPTLAQVTRLNGLPELPTLTTAPTLSVPGYTTRTGVQYAASSSGLLVRA